MMSWDYTPTNRGFDTFLGYYGGALYYYDHFGYDMDFDGYDIRDNTLEYKKSKDNSKYSLHIWSEHVQSIINEVAEKQDMDIENDNDDNMDDSPFFMYVGWQGSHMPSEYQENIYQQYSKNLTEEEKDLNLKRLAFQSQTTETDVLFGDIVNTLKKRNLWDNTLVIFCSDNGAGSEYGDNTPLRGEKGTLWEGGVRVPAFISGGYLPTYLRGKVLDSYPVHVTDWYKTLLSAVGLDVVVSKNEIDGEDVWDLLKTSYKSSIDTYDSALKLNGYEIYFHIYLIYLSIF